MIWTQSKTVLLALGANTPGRWGSPAQTFDHVPDALKSLDVELIARGPRFKTPPLGGNHHVVYLNQTIIVSAGCGPATLLRKLKSLERAAGRRERGLWAARPLDIDIIDHKGCRLGWPRRRTGSLTLPHADCHRRAFVLVPLLALHKHWHHPGLGVRGSVLLSKVAPSEVAAIRRLNAPARTKARNTQL